MPIFATTTTIKDMNIRLLLALCSLPFTPLAAQERTHSLAYVDFETVRRGLFSFGTKTNPEGVSFEVDRYGFSIGDKRLIPVMGELHYSRIPRKEWQREIRKMKAGGITILSTYTFWIHHEEQEGQWDWSDNKDLRAFLKVCKDENMPVVLRLGPFCHGEVYQGGMPVWLVQKSQADPSQYKLRSEAKGFLAATDRLYHQIGLQAKGLLWKDGGPVVGVQIENECRGPWSYYATLRKMAIEAGFDVPFMTRTGWPKLNGKEEFGQLLPLYGDYADGFWDRTLDDMPGDYRKAFEMKRSPVSATIATETFSAEELNASSLLNANDAQDFSYPYLTCELGGGMMPSYHRRINISGSEAFPLAICKLGSGSNLPGYYMYHGGSNTDNAAHSMAECQDSPVTNYNDMPHITYDFQSPLGEMGQPNWEAFHQTRWLHQFLADWGTLLSQMPVDSLSEHYARRGNFEFRNDYVRILNEQGKASVTLYQMPYKNRLLTTKNIQPLAKIGDQLVFISVKGNTTPPVLRMGYFDYELPIDLETTINGIPLLVLSPEKARSAYVIDGRLHFAKHGGILFKTPNGIEEEAWEATKIASNRKSLAPLLQLKQTQKAGPLREVKMGKQKVAEQPNDADFKKAAVWTLSVPNLAEASKHVTNDDVFLEINYRGDCARIYANGVLVQDNFWNGKPMLVRASQLQGKKVELRILPMGKDYPIYLQREQKEELEKADEKTGLLSLDGIRILRRCTYPLYKSR